jgi:ABC-type spermidine/putrescine transport system permease subunit II
VNQSPISHLAARALRWFDLMARIGVIAFMLAPAVVIVLLSFSAEPGLRFPPREWGTRHYRSVIEDETWINAIMTSIAIAVPVAILCIVIGVPAAYAFQRTKVPLKGLWLFLGLAPIVIPAVAYAIAVYAFFVQAGLIGYRPALIALNVALAIPFVILIVGAALSRLPPELELVAMSLGASRARAIIGITLRLLAPAIMVSAVFCFVTAFDEATFVNFVGGPGIRTLPKVVFDSLRFNLDPAITSIASMLMLATGLLLASAAWIRRKQLD